MQVTAVTFNLFDPIQEDLTEIERLMRHVPVKAHSALVGALHYILDSGGKRVRPALTMLVGNSLGGPKGALANLGSAVEMLHTASLVHDDIVDGSLLRRGVSTLNAKWSPGATILTGDFIFARAAQLASAADSVRVMSLFAETLMVIVNGELEQMFEGREGRGDKEAYYERVYAKTGSLFALATEAAAVLATDDEKVVDKMREFGKQLGIAFQIVDDILDFYGKESDIGKPVGGDLRQGLVTLPTLYYIEEHPEDERVIEALQGRKRDKLFMDELIESIRQSGALSAAMDEAKQFVLQAKESLDCLPDGEYKDSLVELADYIVGREL